MAEAAAAEAAPPSEVAPGQEMARTYGVRTVFTAGTTTTVIANGVLAEDSEMQHPFMEVSLSR